MDVSGGRRRGPVPLVMTGSLVPYELLVRTELASLGYAAAGADAVRMMRRLSAWMERRELAPRRPRGAERGTPAVRATDLLGAVRAVGEEREARKATGSALAGP